MRQSPHRHTPINSRAHLAYLVVSITATVSIYFFLHKTAETSKIRQRCFFNYVERSKKRPLAKIFLYSSSKTYDRVAYDSKTWVSHKSIDDGTFDVNVVLSNDAKLEQEEIFKSIRTPCSDQVAKESGLACRIDYSYLSFLNDDSEVSSDWLYRAMDDTWVELNNLYSYIKELEKFVDPKKHLIFKAQINPKHMPDKFIIGGSGWLMSRAFLQYQIANNLTMMRFLDRSFIKQDDTSQALIAEYVFPHTVNYDEKFYIGHVPSHLFDENFNSNNFSNVPFCPANFVVTQLRKVIAIHLFGVNSTMRSFCERLQTYPEDLCFYYLPRSEFFFICRSNENSMISSYKKEFLQDNTPLLSFNHEFKPIPKKLKYYSNYF